MSHLCLHVLPKDGQDDATLEAFAKRMRPLRLASLQNDTTAFISRYESEAEQPLSFWVDRLKQQAASTIVMTRSAQILPANDSIGLLSDDVEWVAFAVMVDSTKGSEVSADMKA